MPIPLIPVVAIGAVAATGALTAYIFNKNKPKKNPPVNPYKNTILLGPVASGKTCLANWLGKKELSDKKYEPTNNDIEINGIFDLSGAEFKVNDWERLIKNKENIFYLFDMEKFSNRVPYAEKTYDTIVEFQISLLTEEFAEAIRYKKVIIIGTHYDKIDEKTGNNIINELSSILNGVKIIFGSLFDKQSAKELQSNIDKLI